MMNSQQKCSRCKGKGTEFASFDPCVACGGQGSIVVVSPPVKCLRCKGKGTEFASFDPCIACGGCGWAHRLSPPSISQPILHTQHPETSYTEKITWKQSRSGRKQELKRVVVSNDLALGGVTGLILLCILLSFLETIAYIAIGIIVIAIIILLGVGIYKWIKNRQ